MNLMDDKRVVMTLDAGGTNLVFSAMRGMEEVAEPVRLPAYGDDLERSLEAMTTGFRQVMAQLPEAPVAISFAFPGPADYPNGIIVLKYLEAKGGMPFVLLHEICHLFGAVDIEEPGSVMSLQGASFRIDRFTREIMAVNRDRSFRRGACPLTPDRAAEALAVYGRREALHLGEPELRICLDELRAMMASRR